MEGKDVEFVEDLAGRVRRFKAPERISPTGKIPLDRLAPEFEAARKRSLEFVTNTKANLRRYFAPHPVIGEIDCYQWVLLLGAHCDRHRAQSEEVKADPNFPRAAAAV